MRYPDPSWLTTAYLGQLETLLETLGGEEERFALRSVSQNYASLLEEMQVEYTRLFINGFPHVVAPPYGSVYLEKTLRGKYSDDVLLFYHAHGYVLKEPGELPDNLIYQLEMLSFLAEAGNHQAEQEFLKKFFLPWFPVFADKVIEGSRHPFYPIIIRIIDFFTKEEPQNGL